VSARVIPTHDRILLSLISEIEGEIVEHANRRWWWRLFHAKYDKEKVQGWSLDFQKTLGIFNVGHTPQFTQCGILKILQTALNLNGTFVLFDIHQGVRDLLAREDSRPPQIVSRLVPE